MEYQDIFEPIEATDRVAVGHTVHSNTHNHALVENPFAWDEEDDEVDSES